ncbi:MAG: cupin domain-containing protein [Candidatus Thorarchaeota archaeon]|nr:MAG: cupin domain-containing protein [Candidatus Thorarchaeota archaeon]RLI59747.1 MAG: cupin domain-containing protein [Candidatus Thorarchaeota archaeon]
MIVRRLEERDEIKALDDTRVREILNPNHDEGDLLLGYSLAHAIVAPNAESLPHRFKEASEVYFILKGRGLMHVNDETAEIGVGDTVYIPPGATQYVENLTSETLEFLCMVSPPWTPDSEERV